ncbi:MAG TPA: LPS export ABC transporter periplasmic protein LptC [Steroidobacteraceae bacterium]|nr:LPS export ABC transporter periplasmic protein LptC [Steroidobacteraceae bacterium]
MLLRFFTVLAVVALAVSTWILSTPRRIGVTPAANGTAQRPGYYLKDAVLTDYDRNGAPSIRIAAARIDQIDGGEQVALHDIRVDYQAPGGESWVMLGDLAHIAPGGKTVQVQGDVRLQGVDPKHPGTAVIRSERMTYEVADAVARTTSAVRIDFAGQTLTARGLVADLKGRNVTLESNVDGRFVP